MFIERTFMSTAVLLRAIACRHDDPMIAGNPFRPIRRVGDGSDIDALDRVRIIGGILRVSF